MNMEAITPQRQAEMLADYQHLRQIGLRLNTKMVQSLDKEAIDEAVGRNDPCPCGSGRKFKNCCRRQSP
jgi:uncharacterized protein YecA (UPF0149 family)